MCAEPLKTLFSKLSFLNSNTLRVQTNDGPSSGGDAAMRRDAPPFDTCNLVRNFTLDREIRLLIRALNAGLSNGRFSKVNWCAFAPPDSSAFPSKNLILLRGCPISVAGQVPPRKEHSITTQTIIHMLFFL